MWFYEAWDSVKCELNDFPISYMPVRDLDERLDYYTPVIIAGNQVLEEKPEMVKKFLAATSRGYGFAMENRRRAQRSFINMLRIIPWKCSPCPRSTWQTNMRRMRTAGER